LPAVEGRRGDEARIRLARGEAQAYADREEEPAQGVAHG
jgi:hypothetical protein